MCVLSLVIMNNAHKIIFKLDIIKKPREREREIITYIYEIITNKKKFPKIKNNDSHDIYYICWIINYKCAILHDKNTKIHTRARAREVKLFPRILLRFIIMNPLKT